MPAFPADISRTTVFRLQLALLVLALTGCLTTDHAYYPFDASTWWVYRVSSSVLDETREARFVARNLGRHADGRLHQAHQAYGLSAIDFDGSAVTRHPLRYSAPAQPLLPLTPAAGQRWRVASELRVIESRTFARQDRVIARHYPVTIEKSIVAFDAAVTTSAGRFENCLLVRGHGAAWVRTDRGNSSAEVTVETREWYAPARGAVRVERSETSTSTFLIDGRESWDLIDYGG